MAMQLVALQIPSGWAPLAPHSNSLNAGGRGAFPIPDVLHAVQINTARNPKKSTPPLAVSIFHNELREASFGLQCSGAVLPTKPRPTGVLFPVSAVVTRRRRRRQE